MKEVNQLIEELKKYLYYNHIENSDIDKNSIQKSLFKLLRECIKNQIYEIEVGSYNLNITPQNLSVIYEDDNTYIEVSNKDIHVENTFDLGDEYFVISTEEKECFDICTPSIRVLSTISSYDDNYEIIYEITISDDIDDDIRNYIILNNGFVYSDNKFNNKYQVIVKKNIDKNKPFIPVYEILNKKIVKPVTYVMSNDNYVNREISYNKKYSDFIPILSDKKLVTTYLYGLMVEFYTNYISKNN